VVCWTLRVSGLYNPKIPKKLFGFYNPNKSIFIIELSMWGKSRVGKEIALLFCPDPQCQYFVGSGHGLYGPFFASS